MIVLIPLSHPLPSTFSRFPLGNSFYFIALMRNLCSAADLLIRGALGFVWPSLLSTKTYWLRRRCGEIQQKLCALTHVLS